MGSIHLSLVSHTNVGKTALARTLLGRDVGEVRDAPHVTDFADGYTMLRSAAGDTLELWDTPGFGDSARLLKRLHGSRQPLGWFMTQVWDRWRDRPFWASQQALRNVAEQADVMLYLVSAAEAPEAAGYVDAEMQLLGWVDKPVVALLNQLGAPRDAAAEAAEVERWRAHLARHPQVRDVLPMDAFARCWVQEIVLLRAIEHCLDGEQRRRMARLSAAWQVRQLTTFDAAVQALAGSIGALAGARQELPDHGGLRTRLRQLGSALGLPGQAQSPQALAQAALAAQMNDEVLANLARLIELHGLAGRAQAEILERLAEHYQLRLRVDESKSAVVGGVLTGALAGLKADLASGGLTMGGGMLAGGLLGALGGAGLARGVNLVRGTQASWVAWNAAALDAMLEAALLRYLAVAHFGRGRGEWARAETPAHWKDAVAQVLADKAQTLAGLWNSRTTRAAPGDEAQRLARELAPVIDRSLRAVLLRLYPQAPVPPAAG